MKNSDRWVLVDTTTDEVVDGIYTSENGANKSRIAYIEKQLFKDSRDGLIDSNTARVYCHSMVTNRRFLGSKEEIDRLKNRIDYYEQTIQVRKIKEIIYE